MTPRVPASVFRVTAFLALLLTGVTAAGCARSGAASTLIAPSSSPAAGALTLTISVHARKSETPIEGALVRYLATGSYTDASGLSSVSVSAGRETTIDVSAAGFGTMTASAVLNSDERWTFFLEQNPQ
jgi:hypothetical protein